MIIDPSSYVLYLSWGALNRNTTLFNMYWGSPTPLISRWYTPTVQLDCFLFLCCLDCRRHLFLCLFLLSVFEPLDAHITNLFSNLVKWRIFMSELRDSKAIQYNHVAWTQESNHIRLCVEKTYQLTKSDLYDHHLSRKVKAQKRKKPLISEVHCTRQNKSDAMKHPIRITEIYFVEEHDVSVP